MFDYKEGDWVQVVRGNGGSLPENSKWEVYDYYVEDNFRYVALKDYPQNNGGNIKGANGWDVDRFILIKTKEHVDSESNIQRPVLEERKVGKVKMQLFDEGFPNAILEIAKVMGWAEENKGYKPNDFKNLPNAETEFSAAASRHRVKGFIQKAQGVPAIERTDEESNIVHLAHTCFNCLAELELVLTGKIK